MATNAPAAVSNVVAQQTGIVVNVPDSNDPVEREYLKLLDEDDAAQAEVDKWIREAQGFAEKGAPLSQATLNKRIEQRFESVQKAYEDFLRRHPNHARARLAYGSFLGDIGDEPGSVKQWEKARELEPSNPAAWNNLANHYGHRGGIKKAFEYYAKAIELDPEESVYYHNFGTSVFLFRKDAMEHYNINEQQVFDKAMELYAKALKLDPKNFPLATDVAQTYYGIKPARHDDAIAAWEYALKIANDDIEREGVYVHLARNYVQMGKFDDARKYLAMVKSPMYDVLKGRVQATLERKESEAKEKKESAESAPAPQKQPKAE